MIRSLCILLAVGLQPAATQQVFKCVEDGQASYQSSPCVGAPAKTWNVTAAAQGVMRRRAETPVAVRSDRRPTRSSGAGGRRGNTHVPLDACTRAQQGREAAYRKAGLKRGFALSSLWDNRVHDSCR